MRINVLAKFETGINPLPNPVTVVLKPLAEVGIPTLCPSWYSNPYLCNPKPNIFNTRQRHHFTNAGWHLERRTAYIYWPSQCISHAVEKHTQKNNSEKSVLTTNSRQLHIWSFWLLPLGVTTIIILITLLLLQILHYLRVSMYCVPHPTVCVCVCVWGGVHVCVLCVCVCVCMHVCMFCRRGGVVCVCFMCVWGGGEGAQCVCVCVCCCCC